MRIKLDLEEFDMFSTWWKGIGRETVVKHLGKMTMDTVETAFKRQGKQGEWPPRYAPNIAGIIRRLNKQEDPKDTDFIVMPALIDSGALRNSFHTITFMGSDSPSRVHVFSTSPYAYNMQNGIVDRLKLSPIGRRHLALWLKGLSKDDRKIYREDIGFLLNKKLKRKRYKIRPNKRNMLSIDEMDRLELGMYIRKNIEAFQDKPKYIVETEITTNLNKIFRKNVVDVELGKRMSHFARKGLRGKQTYKIFKRVKASEAPKSFTKRDNYKEAYRPFKFPKSGL